MLLCLKKRNSLWNVCKEVASLSLSYLLTSQQTKGSKQNCYQEVWKLYFVIVLRVYSLYIRLNCFVTFFSLNRFFSSVLAAVYGNRILTYKLSEEIAFHFQTGRQYGRNFNVSIVESNPNLVSNCPSIEELLTACWEFKMAGYAIKTIKWY